MEELIEIISALSINEEQKELLLTTLKALHKDKLIFEFKYKRTQADKVAITNILNASIEEIKTQKQIIENAKDEINRTLIEVDKQKKLIEEKNRELNELLSNLKKAQKQLIMSEKMASLGELTAGIAHEIKNPLNFVNNFSEVSKELLDEMKAELNKGNTIDAKEIADDVIKNLEKINYHGKRADAIIKGMLQHSRGGSGQKDPTNINTLTDEYLRLIYHGLKAKNNTLSGGQEDFNVTLKTDYDKTLSLEEEKINIVPQDVGRVILNLLTNAFYAVGEKKKRMRIQHENAAKVSKGYQPTVSVITKKLPGRVEIKIKDNGDGIPAKVLDKIFQPFFTTKPSGKGTGLGLSLSYDIIKAMGGELKMDTKEGKGSVFTISILC
ncbi:MAG: ATP-binding protein [Bacteroidota bacterium]|nr:ATP-binding protein [Bacteroidota bacterium]